MKFKLKSDYQPTGDQPTAIKKLTDNYNAGVPHQVLLGVTGSGKSLAYDEPILVYCGKTKLKPKILPIGQLIDKLFEKEGIIKQKETDILEANRIQEKFKVLSFDHQTGKQEIKPIKTFIRHSSPPMNFQITTVCGREVEVTGDHNFWVLRKGRFFLVKTREIQQNDYLPIPMQIPAENQKQLKTIWLNNWIEGDTFFNIKDIYPKKNIDFDNLKKTVGKQKFWRIINNGERINLKYLSSSVKQIEHCESLKIGRRIGKQSKLGLIITDSFLRLVGLYLAEGHGERNYLLISVHESSLKKILIHDLNKLQTSFKERNLNPGDFQISNSILAEIFGNWCGKRASEKILPAWFMELNNDQLALMLSAYFSGDGSVSNNEISAISASKKLISTLSYALLRFGIKTRIRRKLKKATNSTMNLQEYYELNISGQEDLKKFAHKITFILTRKQNKLEQIITKKTNTNVDIIPIDGSILKKLREEVLKYSQHKLSLEIKCSRSYISLLESNQRHPSRVILKKIIKVIRGVLQEGKEPKDLLFLDSLTKMFWTKIKNIRALRPSSRYVYDVAVEKNETFLAGWGGLFVHNTFTVANLIQNIQKPTLVISHNKTLAGQLYQEFKEYFPENAVSYFVSYYDYYQPEAYIPQTDTYISKESDINQEIDKLRLQATSDIFSQDDVLIVASVSCIYNIGSPLEYKKWILNIKVDQELSQEDFLYKLVSMHYNRSRLDFERGTFRQRGNSVEIYLSYDDEILKVTFEDKKIATISLRPVWTTETRVLRNYALYPAKHYIADPDMMKTAFGQIREDLKIRLNILKKENKQIEAYRLEQRVNYDLEMMAETGYVNGIENYSRYFDGRKPGDPPYSLIDYFKEKYSDDYLIVVDESHMTIPQIRGMYNGDFSRKQTLIDFGFRLPSALDNRPLKFAEFLERIPHAVFASATPDEWEIKKSEFHIAEQLIRPTGLIDPVVEVRPSDGQVQDLIKEIHLRKKAGQRVLVTTLTKRMAEDLSSFIADETNTGEKIEVHYLHADIDTLERSDILADLRGGKYDVIVGINLLREGLDLPEVSLVAILDADKQGFLRSRTALIQTMGRAARNTEGKVILYADEKTEAMLQAISEVNRRRKIQTKYNQTHGITPKTIEKPIRERIIAKQEEENKEEIKLDELTPGEQTKLLPQLKRDMRQAAKDLDFENAIRIRDLINKIQKSS